MPPNRWNHVKAHFGAPVSRNPQRGVTKTKARTNDMLTGIGSRSSRCRTLTEHCPDLCLSLLI
jgi:hypothetical protein